MTAGILLLLALPSPREIIIDATKSKPISPYIYGINYPDNWIYEWLDEWNQYHNGYTLAREGGNRFTAYNWETNASNAGNDYHHENDDYLAVSNEPGWTVRQFLSAVQSKGAAALITVPTLGYVSADKDGDKNGHQDVGTSPDYLQTRFHRSFAVNPKGPHFPPDTSDKNVYQDEFVAWVEKVKSPKTPVFYSLDNEPDFWFSTHARLMPQKPTYDFILKNQTEYAAMIKSIAPKALVFGPANYGWQGMKSFQDAPDANGRDFVETYLDSMRGSSKKAGHRLLDAYDFHWYPEARGDGIRIIYNQAPDKPGTERARIQAPRSLWDPNYIEDSWIPQSLNNKPIAMLPRMQAKIDKHFPGTKMAITEYEFGGRNTISGALAQADALGVFGRFGLFAACHWGVNHTDRATTAAFKAFTDFDGKGARFGDLGLPVRGESPAENSVYAARDSHQSNRVTVVIINKSEQKQSISMAFNGFAARTATSYVVTSASFEQTHGPEVQLGSGHATVDAPPLSIMTIELRR
jgi:hypothetical protein